MLRRLSLAMFTLLLATPAVAQEKAASEKNAVLAIERLGGMVHQYHDDRPVQTVRYVLLTGDNVTDRTLAQLRTQGHLKALTQLFGLDLTFSKVTNAGLTHLAELRDLQSLVLDFNNVTDASILQLKKLAKLAHLSLNGAELSEQALRHLPLLPKLESLSLNGTKLTAESLRSFRKLQHLKRLELSEISDADLTQLKPLTTLESLFLSKSTITAAGLKTLKSALPRCRVYQYPGISPFRDKPAFDRALKAIWKSGAMPESRITGSSPQSKLYFHNISDDALVYLKELQSEIQYFVIFSSRVTNRGMNHLSKLTEVRILGLNCNRVTDDGLVHLSRLTKLRMLSLGCERITDDGLAHLKNLTKLRSLTLVCDKIVGSGMRHIPNHELEDLSLECQRLSDDELAHLKRFSKLRYLSLRGAGITDGGIKHLRGLTRLNQLYLRGSKVTADGVKMLQTALPKCSIHTDETQAAADLKNAKLNIKFGDIFWARKNLSKLIKKFPATEAAKEARSLLRHISTDEVAARAGVTFAKLALKRGNIAAARRHLAQTLAQYPKTKSTAELQTLLKSAKAKLNATEKAAALKLRVAKSFLKKGRKTATRKWLNEIINKFPGSNAAGEARKLLKSLED